MSLFVRTGNAGTDPAVAIDDLGITIQQSTSWTELPAGDPGDPGAGGGQFTARELRDSVDLHTAITTAILEWSKDGVTLETASSFIADVPITQDFSDDSIPFDPNRLVIETDGKLVFIGLGDLVITGEPQPGPA